jgi:hypothetical protein
VPTWCVTVDPVRTETTLTGADMEQDAALPAIGDIVTAWY